MFRESHLYTLVLLLAAIAVGWARADVAFPIGMPFEFQIAQSDLVAVGTVVAILDQDEELALRPGDKRKVRVRIAVVKLDSPVLGEADKLIRIAYPARALGPAAKRRAKGNEPPLKAGDTAVFMVKKHHDRRLYLLKDPWSGTVKASSPVSKFNAILERIRRICKIAKNPRKYLESRDLEARFTAAAYLVGKYRTPPATGSAKQVPIDAKESKLILQAILDRWDAEAKQKLTSPRFVVYGSTTRWEIGPKLVFMGLGLTAKDRFVPKVGVPFFQYAHRWLADNIETYRIRRFVAERNKAGT